MLHLCLSSKLFIMKKLPFLIVILISLQTYGQGKKALENIIDSRNEEITIQKAEIEKLSSENKDLKQSLIKSEESLQDYKDKYNNLVKENDKRDELEKKALEKKELKVDTVNIVQSNVEYIDLIIKHDEFRKLTYYQDKIGDDFQYDYDVNTPNTKLSLYFSILDNTSKAVNLRLIIGFEDDNWLFLENITFLIDDKQYIVTGDFEKDNDRNVYEWIDKKVDVNLNNLIKAIIKGQTIKVRFTGNQYYKDGAFSQKQIDGVKNIYKLYFDKGGKL